MVVDATGARGTSHSGPALVIARGRSASARNGCRKRSARPRPGTPTNGFSLRAGRTFTSDDWKAFNAVVINETMARRFWPNGDALGQRVQYAGENTPSGQRGVTVRFAPTASGSPSATLVISSNDPARLAVPQ